MSEGPDPSHLLHLIEKQPSCLLRVGRDGVLLACNDAGLSLLRKTELAQVLDRGFEEHLHADHAASWREFADRVWVGGAGSLECDFVVGGAPRTVQVKAIALRNHPDGLESLLLSLRDTSPLHRLEQSLENDGIRAKLAETEERLTATLREREELTTWLDALRAEQQRLSAALKESENERGHAAGGQRELDALRGERQQLAASLQERERELEAAREETRVIAAKLREAEGRIQLAADEREQLTSQIDALRVEQQRLAALSQQSGDERQRLAASLQQSDSERQRLAASLQQTESERAMALERAADNDRQLESALRTGTSAGQQLLESQAKLEAALAEQRRLASLLDDSKSSQQQLGASLRELYAERERSTQERRQLEAALRERQTEHERALDERRRLEASLQSTGTLHQQLSEAEARIADAIREREQLAQTLEASRLDQAQLTARFEESHADRDRLAATLETSESDRERLTAALDEREAQHRRQREADVAEHARLRRSADERESAARALERDTHARIDALEARLAAALAEHGELQQQFDAYRVVGDDAAALAEQHRGELAELEQRIAELQTDRTRLADQVEALGHARLQLEAERDAAAAARSAADARLQHALTRAETIAVTQHTSDRQSLEALQVKHDEMVADAERTAALVKELRRLAADHDAARARLERALADARTDAAAKHDQDRRRLEEVEARYAQALAEQQRLVDSVERDAVERRRLDAEHASTRAEIERRLAEQHERTAAVHDRERTELIANLQAELVLAVADQRRLQTLLARAESDQHRLIAAHAADRAEADRSLGEAMFKKNQIAKTLADQRVELDEWREAARALEPLAAAGRLALHISRELHEMVASLDDRARFLLSVSSLDATHRPEVEQLRIEAMRAASLARQLTTVDRDAASAAPAVDAVSADAAHSEKRESV